MLLSFPPDILLQVSKYLDLQDTLNLARVNRFINHFIQPEIYRGGANTWIDECTSYFHRACRSGDEKLVRKLLQFGANVHARNPIGIMPIHEAISNRRKEVIDCLVAHGASVDAQTDDDKTPLHLIADDPADGQSATVYQLVNLGANTDLRDAGGCTPLQCAVTAEYPNVEVVRALVELGASTQVTDADGRSPLQAAIEEYRDRDEEHLTDQFNNRDYEYEFSETAIIREQKEATREVARFLTQHLGLAISDFPELYSSDDESLDTSDNDSTGRPSIDSSDSS